MATVKLQLVKEQDELDPLYRIGAEAWKDDPFFNWFFPGGREHFDDAILLWQSALQSYFLEKGKFVLVAIASTDESPSKKVVGFAVWERRGSSEAAKCWQGTTISKSMISIWRILTCICAGVFVPFANIPRNPTCDDLLQERLEITLP